MRNVMKCSGARNSKARRSVRGLSAVLASLALTAGLASYPAEVTAQESEVVSDDTSKAVGGTPSATTPETSTLTETSTATGAPSPEASDGESPVQVSRVDGVDLVTVDDPDGEAWGYGAKASGEDIFAIKRSGSGDIEEILRVTIDGEELDSEFYGYVNNGDGGYLAFDIDALNEVPPRNVEFEVRTTEEAAYSIAESNEVPSARDLSESGYGKNPNAAATVNPDGVGAARAAAEKEIWNQKGVYDQELQLSNAKATWVNNNPELQFTVNEVDEWRMTRFAIKKDRNDTNTKSITQPVRIRVIRDGKTVSDRTFSNLKEIWWHTNAKGQSFDTEFQLSPVVNDLTFYGGDTIIMNVQGPPNGVYGVQVWGQNISEKVSEHSVSVSGNGIPVSEHVVEGNNPFTTRFNVTARSKFSSAKIVLGPTAVVEDVSLTLETEGNDGSAKLAHEVKTFPDRVEITWSPTIDGKKVDYVIIPEGAAVTLVTKYKRSITRPEDLVLNGAPAETATQRPRLPIESSEELDVPPVTTDGICRFRDTDPVSRKEPRGLSAEEEKFGSRRYIVASPASSGNRASSQLYLGVEENGKSENYAVGPKQGWVYNALAYNEKDNYLYAITQARATKEQPNGSGGTYTAYADDPCFPAGHLLQINPLTGEVYDLGKVDGFSGQLPENKRNETANDLGSGINSGTFDQNGNYWVAAASNWGSGGLYQVDLDKPKPKATMKGNYSSLSRKTPWNQNYKYRTVSEDLVSLPQAPSYLWGIQSSWAHDGSSKVYLERVSLTGEESVRIDITDKPIPGTNQTVAQYMDVKSGRFHTFGQAWVEENGVLAFGLGGGSVPNGQHEAQVIKLKVENANVPFSQRNKITATVVGTELAPVSYNTDAASASAVSLSPITPQVSKVAPSTESEEVGDGIYRARYQVIVSNPDQKRGVEYSRVYDKPEMPEGISILRGTWVRTDEFGGKTRPVTQQGSGPFILSEGGTITAKGFEKFGSKSTGKHVYDVEIYFTLAPSAQLSSDADCSSGKGLVNRVEVGSLTAEACVPPPKIAPQRYGLTIHKVDSDNHEVSLDNAAFEVRWADSDQQRAIALTAQNDSGRYTVEDQLELGREYELVETKSPNRDGQVYSLLTSPIRFRITNQDGDTKIQFMSEGEWVDDISDRGVWVETLSDSATVALKVANIRQGNLPRTGGAGLLVPTLAGFAIVALGAAMGARRKTS